jgi:hypothetical protein
MFKLVTLAVLLATAMAASNCGCEDVISGLEKRVEFLESKLNEVLGNSKHLSLLV